MPKQAEAPPFIALMWAQPCLYCNAKPHERCRSKSGRRMSLTEMHAARYYAAKEEQRKAARG